MEKMNTDVIEKNLEQSKTSNQGQDNPQSSKVSVENNSVTKKDGSKNWEIHDVEVKTKTTEAKAGSSNSQKPVPSPPVDGPKHFTIGEYNVTVPHHKVPLLGVMASALVLLIAILLRNVIFDEQREYGQYGVSLAAIALITAFVSLVMPSSCTFAIFLINYFLFIWSFIGACIMTFDNGPFVYTGNGYFASWGCAIFSALAVGFPKSFLDLGAASVVVLIALAFEIEQDAVVDAYKGEIIYATIVACATICAVGIFAIRKWWRSGKRNSCEPQILIIFAIAWICSAGAVSFSGPFTETGNGYFGAWGAAVLSVMAASKAWAQRNDE